MQNIASRKAQGRAAPTRVDLTYRTPTANDGAEVWKIVAACQPLDQNSVYCNLLQCTDFADTCILAERGGQAVGWVSGYLPPRDPSSLFVWQVAVLPEARGLGLAGRMIRQILRRPVCAEVSRIKTTITPDNEASWALFNSVAESLDAPISQRAWFDGKIHFRGRHETEHMVTIGPIAARRLVPAGGIPAAYVPAAQASK